MNKTLLKILIFISGVFITIFKFNGLNIWNMPLYLLYFLLILAVIIFFGAIVILNISQQKTDTNKIPAKINFENPKQLFNKLDYKLSNKLDYKLSNKLDYKLSNKLKYYLKFNLLNIFLFIYLGYKFKVPIDYAKSVAASRGNNWKDDPWVQMVKYDESLSQVYFKFNWELAIFSFITILAILIFIRNTIYYDKIQSFLQKIKRQN